MATKNAKSKSKATAKATKSSSAKAAKTPPKQTVKSGKKKKEGPLTTVPRTANSLRKARNRQVLAAWNELETTPKPNMDKVQSHLKLAELLHLMRVDAQEGESEDDE